MRSNELDVLINWGDTDMAGIVYYPNYFKWFDIAGHQFFRSCQLSPLTLEKERGVILPMIDVRCTFEKPLYYDDVITIETTVSEVNRKTIKLAHEVYRGKERTGFGYELRGWVEKTDTGIQAVPIPDEIRRILEEDVHTTSQEVKPMYNA
ncbi:acyl-CoA thioester hydrolase [Alteribacillus persepolensis]|uniref:Acyl-CoA thioester hydrolase n=1 Tax=Alteribacillus persepolensis TaxID=568899 RepID=A0A1G8KC58_9BACI|nr:thioesterase family protein [Alteribacillus persepolensis]SDI40973.1 acyl-CoA thioester hydrolase [Alteribacillus persepolensis]